MLRLKQAARQSGSSAGSAASMNMTPMVDMVFLLLIFFLLTSMALSPPILNLDLPSAAHADTESEGEHIEIVIRKGGEIEIDQETVPGNQWEGVLKKRLATTPETKVLLSADKAAPFGLFVEVLDTLHGLNHPHLAILTQKEKP